MDGAKRFGFQERGSSEVTCLEFGNNVLSWRHYTQFGYIRVGDPPGQVMTGTVTCFRLTPVSTLHTGSLQLEVTDDSYDGESAQGSLECGQRLNEALGMRHEEEVSKRHKEEVGMKEPTSGACQRHAPTACTYFSVSHCSSFTLFDMCLLDPSSLIIPPASS
jgi:hypothetical protein